MESYTEVNYNGKELLVCEHIAPSTGVVELANLGFLLSFELKSDKLSHETSPIGVSGDIEIFSSQGDGAPVFSGNVSGAIAPNNKGLTANKIPKMLFVLIPFEAGLDAVFLRVARFKFISITEGTESKLFQNFNIMY